MDPKLAEMYGTNQPDEADLEKLAAAELAEGLAGDDQIDVDNVSEEELEAMAQGVLEGGEEQPEGDEPADEDQEKIAEADYLGRVMAHSYVQELRGIEKEASAKGVAAAKATKALASTAKKMTNKANKRMTFGQRASSELRGVVQGRKAAYHEAGQDLKSAVKGRIKGLPGKMSTKERLQALGSAAKGVAPELAAGSLAVGGGAYAAKKHMDKESSALGTLVESRAAQILEASGIDPETLQPMQEQEKVSDANDVLTAAVEQRAWELLDQLGFEQSEE
jgi:hypothetical protein